MSDPAFHEVRFPTDLAFNSTGGPERLTEVVRLGSGQRGAQHALGRIAPPIRCRLRHPHPQRPARGDRLLRGAARPAPWVPLPRPARLEILRAGGKHRPRRTAAIGTRRRRHQSLPARQGLWRVVDPVHPHHRQARGRHGAHCRRRGGEGRGTRFHPSMHRPASSPSNPRQRRQTMLVIKAGFEFDVPVRFDTDRLEINLAAFEAGELPSVPLKEILP